jgi:hypothetical protein
MYVVACGFIAISGCTCDDNLAILKAVVEVEPEVLDFGQVAVNSTKELTLTLRNKGSFFLTVDEWMADAPFTPPTGTATISTFGEVQVTVSFTPTMLGNNEGMLVFSTDAEDQPMVTVPLRGVGIEAAVKVEPSLVDFGEVLWTTDTDTQRRTVTVSNPGSDDFDLTGIELTDDGAMAFALEPGNIVRTFAPGASETFDVTYTPNAMGDVTGSVRLTTTTRAAPEVVVPIKAKAVGPQFELCSDAPGGVTLCTADMQQPRVDFLVGRQETAMGALRAINAGDRELTVTQTFITGTPMEYDFSPAIDTAAPFTLGPGQTMTFQVTYTPADYDFDAVIASFSSNSATRSLASARLEGRVRRPTIEVRPRGVTFGHTGNVRRGQTPVRIFNCGDEVLVLTQAPQITGASVFSIEQVPANGTMIMPQPNCTDPATPAGAEFNVVFETSTDGTYSGTVNIFSNDPVEGQVQVSVMGRKSS